MKRSDLVALCKEFASIKYEEGCDRFVECYGDAEWDEFLNGIITWSQARRKLVVFAERWMEKDAEADRYKEDQPSAADY